MNRPNEISLCDLNTSTACIIVDHPDGFLYTNQTHHYDCRQSESQGYLLPLGVMIRVCWDHAGPEFMKGQPLMPPVEAQERILTALDTGQSTYQDFAIEPHPDNGEAWLRCSFTSPMLAGDDSRLWGWLTWFNCD